MEGHLERSDYRQPTGLEGKRQYHIACGPGDVPSTVIVPGDQGRVPLIVSELANARLIADNRGLITYRGRYRDVDVGVTSTGMGGPSAAIAYEELINLGVTVLIRVGSVAGLQPELEEGDLVIPYACVRDDGVSRYYVPENYPAAASPPVYQALIQAAGEMGYRFHTGINWTHSAFYARTPEYFDQWVRKRVVSMEMEAAALMVVASLRGVHSGFIGTVYANRYRQSRSERVDLSVDSPSRDVIQRGVRASIRIALEAARLLAHQLQSGSPDGKNERGEP
ncbi:nucleoside phosphorylase [Carboxydochorda subterranea]|uniref:Uridine phosphorylase n=1 Tax=Carboxydichorda subterranea TaxID=3109565 RepID=A0ABZ1BU48_9FIRM|nr:nucleoside phosphorylase [Limnochorda sp. L945t]WRP16294.1 nucleoside phosphorylase [Limnochorda sp. L945t]